MAGDGELCLRMMGELRRPPRCQDLLEGVDLATLNEETVAALLEELQEPDLPDSELDFAPGQ